MRFFSGVSNKIQLGKIEETKSRTIEETKSRTRIMNLIYQ